MSFVFRLDRRVIIAIAGAMVISLMSSIAIAATVTLAWDSPENSDAVAGYHIYYGESPDSFKKGSPSIEDIREEYVEIEGLEPGNTYWFAATSHDGNDGESDFSEEIEYAVPFSTYTVKMTVVKGSGGSIQFAKDDLNCKGTCTIDSYHGDSPSFTIVPDNGYQISDVWIDDLNAGAIASHTFENIEEDHSITVQFSPKEYTIAASASKGGTIDPSDEITVLHGESESFSFKALEGYELTGLDVNGDSIEPKNPYILAGITADYSIHATFTAISSGGGSGDDGNTDNAPDTGDDNGEDNDSGTGDDNDVGDDSGEVPGDDIAVPAEQLPNTPVLIEPEENAILYPDDPVRFETDIYSHPEGDVHNASRWQIRRVDKKNYFYDEITEESTTHEDSINQLRSGLKYAWRVGFQNVGSNQYSWSEERHFVVGEEIVDDKTPAVNRGQARNDFKMVSFTHWTDDNCSEKTFSSLLESDYAYGDYRIATYDPTLEGGGGYREYGDFEVVPGKAFWILARNGIDLTRKGVPVTTEEDIDVPLSYNAATKNGWAMVAVPNNAVYSWGDIEIHVFDDEGELVDGPKPIRQLSQDNPYIDKRVWEWQNGTVGKYKSHNSNDFKLTPHTGYWVKARSANVTLVFPRGMPVATSNPGALLTNLWHAGIDWIGEKLSPGSVFADLSSDDVEPPLPMDGLSDNSSNESSSDSSASCFIGTISGKRN